MNSAADLGGILIILDVTAFAFAPVRVLSTGGGGGGGAPPQKFY